MSNDDINQFGKLEDPAERKAEELRSRKENRSGYKKKKSMRSVSLSTFKASTGIVTLLVWLVFLVAVGYGTYRLITVFANG